MNTSNKMPKASNIGKTESARNFLLGGLVAVAAFGSLLGLAGLLREYDPCVKVREACLKLELATTPQAHTQGLSGRASLPPDRAMLFVFGLQDRHCFWMKDMRFPLDIVWLNQDKQVVHIETDVRPETYPQTFCPSDEALYVLELNAGKAAAGNIVVGDTLRF